MRYRMGCSLRVLSTEAMMAAVVLVGAAVMHGQTTTPAPTPAPATKAVPAGTWSAPQEAKPVAKPAVAKSAKTKPVKASKVAAKTAAKPAPLPAAVAAPAAAAATPTAVPADVAAPAPTMTVAPVPAPMPKAKKNEYTGPTEIVELAPTPMLDEEGKQRMDPDGKLMFNPPVKQQRDKKGHPVFDEKGKPVFQTAKELGYDEHGKKIHEEKVKPPKATPVSIQRGTLTVDGLIGKAALNYDIPDLKYIYLYAPGIGIAVVGHEPFPGAIVQKDAFNDKTLTIAVQEHKLELASDKRILDKKPEPAYVLLDRDFVLPSKFPVMGYGTVRKAPYAWPGAKPNAELAGIVKPPPLAANLTPVQLLKACPPGQMRPAGPAALPGQVVKEQPCTVIPKSVPVQLGSKPVAKPAATAAVPAAPGVVPAAPKP